jgi:hypothetical protein
MRSLLDKYRLPVFQAPDPVAPGPAADPAAPDPAAAAAAANPDPPASPDPAAPGAFPDAAISVITGLRGKTRELEAQNAELARKAQEAQALAERLARGQQPDPAAPRAPVAPVAPAITPAPATDDAVNQRARFLILQDKIGTMLTAGQNEFGAAKWNDTVKALQAVGWDGEQSYQFTAEALAVSPDNAHAVLHTLAQDPTKALSLVGMDPARRIAELTRIAMAAAPKTADPKPADPAAVAAAAAAAAGAKLSTKVSKAPAPAPVLDPSTTTVVDWRTADGDKLTDAEWSKRFDEENKWNPKRRSA